MINKCFIGYRSLFAFLSHLFALLTLVVPSRGSKENWSFYHHVVPVCAMCNKDSASNIQPTSYEPTTGYSSTSVEYFNKSWKVRSIGCLCMSKALLLLRKSSSGFCIRVALNFNPLWVHSWAFMLLYKLQGVSGEKTNILGRDIFRSLCRRIENIHTKVCVISDGYWVTAVWTSRATTIVFLFVGFDEEQSLQKNGR